MTDKETVHEAWNAVMRDVQAIRKDSVNKQQNFNFRGVDAVMNAVGPVLRNHGVIVVPVASEAHYRDVTYGSKDTKAREATVLVTYQVFGPAGDSFTMQVPAEALDSGDKATAKAMSVAYRTVLLQSLTIPTDDPDPDEEVFERAAEPEPVNYAELGWTDQAQHDAEKQVLKLVAQALPEDKQAEAKKIFVDGGLVYPLRKSEMEWWRQQLSLLQGPGEDPGPEEDF